MALFVTSGEGRSRDNTLSFRVWNGAALGGRGDTNLVTWRSERRLEEERAALGGGAGPLLGFGGHGGDVWGGRRVMFEEREF